MKRPRIAVLIPIRERPELEFMTRVYAPLYERAQNPREEDPYILDCGPYLISDMHDVAKARNSLVMAALDRQANYLMWLDADLAPENPHSITQAVSQLYRSLLLTAQARACTGVYREKKNQLSLYEMKTAQLTSLTSVPSNPRTVNAFGLGCCLMEAGIFRSMTNRKGLLAQPWFEWSEESEDLAFCRKLLGSYPRSLYVDPEVRFRHIGLFSLGSDGGFGPPAR